MVKTLQKPSSPEPASRFSRNLLCSIIVCSNDDPEVTLTYFTAMSNLVTQAFLYEKVKTEDFSEIIAASPLKVGRSRHLIEYMKICKY